MVGIAMRKHIEARNHCMCGGPRRTSASAACRCRTMPRLVVVWVRPQAEYQFDAPLGLSIALTLAIGQLWRSASREHVNRARASDERGAVLSPAVGHGALFGFRSMTGSSVPAFAARS